MKKSLVYLAGASLLLAAGGYHVSADTVTAVPSTLSAAEGSTSAQVTAQLVNGQPSLVLNNLVSATETSQITVTVISQSGQAHTYQMAAQADGSYVAYLDAAFHQFDSSQFSARFVLQKADGLMESLASYSFEWAREAAVETQAPEANSDQAEEVASSQSSETSSDQAEETDSSQSSEKSSEERASSQTQAGAAEEPAVSRPETAGDLSKEEVTPAAETAGDQPATAEAGEDASEDWEALVADTGDKAMIHAPAASNASAAANTVNLEDVKGTVAIRNLNHQLGTFEVVVTDVRSKYGLNNVLVPVWSETGGQDDIIWYVAAKQADGSYLVPVKKMHHKYSTGLYQAHVYYQLPDGTLRGVGRATASLQQVESQVSGSLSIQNKNNQTGSFDVVVSNVQSSAGLKSVQIPVWSETGGQDDLKWYTAAKQADGTYKISVKASDHKYSDGLYHAHLYYTLEDGSVKGVGRTTVSFTQTITGTASIQNKNDQVGSFDVVVSNVQSSAGLQQVLIPVWSETGGQDDLKWYTAAKQADGTYKISVKASDHKYSTGVYQAHVYYTLGDGSQRMVARTTANLPQSITGKISVQNKNDQIGTFDLMVTDIQSYAGLKSVQIPVWSETGGQDDLRWYTADRQADGTYKVSVKASDHKYSTGKYFAHLYYTLNDGRLQGVASTETIVNISSEKPSANLQITNVNHQAGSFDVIISNIKSPYGVKTVEVPIWSEADGQDDIVWYTADRQADGSYKVNVQASRHKHSGGLYHAHVYLVQGNGVRTDLLGAATLDLNYQKTRSKTIFIDPGHGGTDPGAVYGGVAEKNLALSVANLLKAKLQANGYTVIMSRTGDQSVDFTRERSRMANSSNADIFVSLHFNASGAGTTTANGIETYWYQYFPQYQPSINQAKHNDPTRLAESELLAKNVQNSLVGATGATNRGVKRATFAVLRETAIPAVLVEMGYMDNPSDLAKIRTAAYQEKLATGLANGILSWYGAVGGK